MSVVLRSCKATVALIDSFPNMARAAPRSAEAGVEAFGKGTAPAAPTRPAVIPKASSSRLPFIGFSLVEFFLSAARPWVEVSDEPRCAVNGYR